MISNVPIGIIETTRAGEIRLANPHLLSLLGLAGGPDLRRIDMSKGAIFPTAEREKFWTRLEADREIRGFDTAFNRADGTPVHVVLNARLRPPAPGSPAVCEGTVEDVTGRRLAAQELEKLHQQLVVAFARGRHGRRCTPRGVAAQRRQRPDQRQPARSTTCRTACGSSRLDLLALS